MDFDQLIADGLGKDEDDAVLLLGELEARLVEVGLDVVELRVVLVLILDLLLEGLVQLLDALLNVSSAESAHCTERHGPQATASHRQGEGLSEQSLGQHLTLSRYLLYLFNQPLK